MVQPDLLARAHALLPRMVDAVGSLVRAESPSEDLAACEDVVRKAADDFDQWGLGAARMEHHAGRPTWRWGPPRPRALLLGHLDTVWPSGTLDSLPFTVEHDRMRGPGVFDMKAGVVQGWAALLLAGIDEGSGVGMLLTTDEETGSLHSRDLVLDACAEADAVLVLEPSVDGALKSARKGTSWYEVCLAGRAAHAGLDPANGINAVSAAAELVLACPGWSDDPRGTTVTPTVLHGGTTSNTVPADAVLTIDVRAWTTGEQHRVDAALRAWSPVLTTAAVAVDGGINRPAMEAAMSASLLAEARAVHEHLGLGPLADRPVGGASDGNFTAAAGIPTLDGLGAVGDGAHAAHEWASIPAMADRAALLAALIGRVLRGPSA
ncbi:MAG: M20/M25/M40 family metallo-hydrolase [Actinomycetota bacterium]|nr:M20/M25/M40 family metallo-hydrolase [Actinomycetota bacterium]